MVPMKPGKDGVPWELCSPCWREGRAPFKLGMFKSSEPGNPDLVHDVEERSVPKQETADFSRPKRGGRKKPG